jgi:hypothetical protein
MKKPSWIATTDARAHRRASTALFAGVLLIVLAGGGGTWAQQPAAAPAAPAAAPAAAANELDPKALDALKGMGAYLRTLKSFSVRSEVTKDEVLASGQKIQFASTVDMRARMPDRLRVDVNSDRKQRQFYYDGKAVTQYAPRVGYYASVAAPGTVRETLAAAADKYDLQIPLSDLFFWGTDKSGIEDIKSAIVVGASRIGTVECDHYAFRQDGVDWQLWIERGKTPLPRKLVITTMDEPERPQYAAVMAWNLAAKVDDKTFAFVPPKDVQKIVMAPVAVAK